MSGTIDPSAFTVDYGTWGGAPANEAIPIQGSSGNIDTASSLQPDWMERNFGPGSSDKLAAALKGLGAAGGGQQQGQGGAGQSAAPYPGPGQAGTPRRPINIAAIVEMLQKRQQDLFGAATAPGGQAQPMPAPRVMGLLGY